MGEYVPSIPRHLTLKGAYSRDYISEDGAIKDWDANKDFVIMTPGYPTYVNKQQAGELKRDGIDTVRLRFNKLGSHVDVTL